MFDDIRKVYTLSAGQIGRRKALEHGPCRDTGGVRRRQGVRGVMRLGVLLAAIPSQSVPAVLFVALGFAICEAGGLTLMRRARP